jgi:hypothetical protein
MSAYRAIQLFIAIGLVISLRGHLVRFHIFVITYVALNWALVLMASSGLTLGLSWITHPGYASAEAAGSWRFASALGHPMSIGYVAATAAIWGCIRPFSSKPMVNRILVGWLIVTAVMTVSRTAIAGLALGLILVAIGRRTFIPVILIILTFVPLTLLVASQTADRTRTYLTRGQTTEEMKDLTGRSTVYDAARARVGTSAITGEGFRASRKDPLTDFGVAHAHNTFLEAYVGLGVLGV